MDIAASPVAAFHDGLDEGSSVRSIGMEGIRFVSIDAVPTRPNGSDYSMRRYLAARSLIPLSRAPLRLPPSSSARVHLSFMRCMISR